MDDFDEYNNIEIEEEDDDDEEDDEKVEAHLRARRKQLLYARPMKIEDHLVLGAPQPIITIAQLAAANPICEDLCALLQFYFEDMEVVGPDGQFYDITPGHQVSLITLLVLYPQR